MRMIVLYRLFDDDDVRAYKPKDTDDLVRVCQMFANKENKSSMICLLTDNEAKILKGELDRELERTDWPGLDFLREREAKQ